MISRKFMIALYVLLGIWMWVSILDSVKAQSCDEVLSSCEEAVVQQETSIKICEDTSKKKDELIDSVKKENSAKEKELENQKTVTKISFGAVILTILKFVIFI